MTNKLATCNWNGGCQPLCLLRYMNHNYFLVCCSSDWQADWEKATDIVSKFMRKNYFLNTLRSFPSGKCQLDTRHENFKTLYILTKDYPRVGVIHGSQVFYHCSDVSLVSFCSHVCPSCFPKEQFWFYKTKWVILSNTINQENLACRKVLDRFFSVQNANTAQNDLNPFLAYIIHRRRWEGLKLFWHKKKSKTSSVWPAIILVLVCIETFCGNLLSSSFLGDWGKQLIIWWSTIFYIYPVKSCQVVIPNGFTIDYSGMFRIIAK